MIASSRFAKVKKNFVIVHDSRLKGDVVCSRPQVSIIEVDKDTSLHLAFGKINAVGDVHTIFILCHGYAGVNVREKICVDAGGMGLELGKECVFHGNVAMWKEIADEAENIVV